MGHLTALKDLCQKGFVIPGSDGTVNLGAYSEAAEKLWRKARARGQGSQDEGSSGLPPGVYPVSTAIESCTGLGVNPRGWTVGVGWIDRLRVSGCIHTLEFLRRPVAEGGVQASSIVYLLKEVGESVG